MGVPARHWSLLRGGLYAVCFRFWPKAVGGQLADDLARSGSKIGDGGRSGSTEMSDCAAALRQIVGKPASYGLAGIGRN
jgi:hypothetical protein